MTDTDSLGKTVEFAENPGPRWLAQPSAIYRSSTARAELAALSALVALLSGCSRTAPPTQATAPPVHNTAPPETTNTFSWLPRPPLVAAGSIPRPPITAANPKDGAAMIFVPAGKFLMGDADLSGNPRRSVVTGAYWIYKNDVTVARYRRFCQATGRSMPEAPSWGWNDHHPIVNVSWDDAKAYCDWAGVSLPTEAQWEKAARGTDGRMYPWGNGWDAARCVCSVSPADANSTAPVGSRPAGASPYGCLDMAGNVWLWCADFYDGSNSGRVLRGGSWGGNDGDLFRCSIRGSGYPDDRDLGVGFRCVLRADR